LALEAAAAAAATASPTRRWTRAGVSVIAEIRALKAEENSFFASLMSTVRAERDARQVLTDRHTRLAEAHAKAEAAKAMEQAAIDQAERVSICLTLTLTLTLTRPLTLQVHDQLPAYASILFQEDGDATAALASSLVDRGYSAVKFVRYPWLLQHVLCYCVDSAGADRVPFKPV
jgi:hypothetical protein